MSDNYENLKLYPLDGLLTEIIGGLIFLVTLIFMLKPSISIAPYIAEIPTYDGVEKHLRFKIVNYSMFRGYDIHVHVYHKERTNISGADITSELIGSYEGYQAGISYLQSGLLALFEDTKTNAAQFRLARLVGSDQKIRDILDSRTSYLEIHIYLRNGLSGLQGNYVKKFNNTSFIKSGYYKHGFSTQITN